MMPLTPQFQRSFEQSFTEIFWFFCFLSLGGALLPRALRHVGEDALIELRGHIQGLQTHFGSRPEENSFSLTLEEYPEKTFQIAGLQEIDQSILTNNEWAGNLFHVFVRSRAIQENRKTLKVYRMNSAQNTYVTAACAMGCDTSNALKEKVLAWIVVLGSGLAAMKFGLLVRQTFRLSTPQTSLDPFLVLFIRRPLLSWAGCYWIGAIFLWIALPHAASVWIGWVSVCLYLLTLVGFYRFAKKDPWILSILSRDEQRRKQLSVRLATVPPQHLKAVELLLKAGAHVDIQDPVGRTPLRIAAEAGHLEAVRLLLKKGATFTLAAQDGLTPLMIAVKKGHLGVVQELLRAGASVHETNEAGESALSLAQGISKNAALLQTITEAGNRETLREKQSIQGQK